MTKQRPPASEPSGVAAAGAETNDGPDLLEALARLELLQRKSDLFERRLASWEEGLDEVRKRLHVLETARAPETPPWEEAIADVRRRLERLERRRARLAEAGEGRAEGGEGLLPARYTASPDDAVAIVRARWSADAPAVGDVVELTAHTDGIEAGTTLPVTIRTLSSSTPLDSVAATCDGDVLRARWKVPPSAAGLEVFFEVEHRQARAKSPVVVIS